MDDSSSPYFWLNSGGKFFLSNETGKTIQGESPRTDEWRKLYARTNSWDTDDGYHPQNLFRLYTRSQWQNFSQELFFNIRKDNLSDSPSRNASNGLFLVNRYANSNNLYAVGIRVDGAAVIKKKKNGLYYTVAYKKIFPGVYNRLGVPPASANLLPKNTWIGLRTEIRNMPDGSVSIKLFMDQGRTGVWQLLLDTKDDGLLYGGAGLLDTGYAGWRTDFMDVEFDDYRLVNL
jgi:hypothetical protein